MLKGQNVRVNKVKELNLNKKLMVKTVDRIKKISNAPDNMILDTFDKIEKDLELDVRKYKDIYMKISLFEVDFMKKNEKKINENKIEFNFDENFECAITEEQYTNPLFIDKLKNLTAKHFNNLMKIFPNRNTMRLLRTAISLSLMMIGIPNFAFAGTTGNFTAKVHVLENGVKMICSLVLFMFLAVELIQQGVKKDSAVVWQILLKYIAIIIALLSYKTIFKMIDEFFRDL